MNAVNFISTNAAPVQPARHSDLPRMRKALMTVAQLVAIDPICLPIFERLEAEIASAEAELINDPIAKARAIAAARKTQ